VAHIAKNTLFATVRILRQAGIMLLVFIGILLVALALFVASHEGSDWRAGQGGAFAADRPVDSSGQQVAEKGAPWSQVMGGRDFDTVTDVAEMASGKFAFAGLSLSMDDADGSAGFLIRTDRSGEIEARHEIVGEELGQIAKIVLDEDGGSRIVHWTGSDLGFARSDAHGRIGWSRNFAAPSDTAWGDIASGQSGHTLIAIAEGQSGGKVRLARLDGDGKVLWRHDLDAGEATADLALAAAGEGGALLALATRVGEAEQSISLRRFDSRGRLVWGRTVYRGRTARLADARLDTDRVSLLIAGEPSGLFVYDTFGTPVWVREIKPLNEAGRHALARSAGTGYQVIGEPRHSGGSPELWLARFGEDGSEIWTKSRANRTNASFESLHVSHDGLMLAGGSLTDPLVGNTDLFMMSLSARGDFPSGYDSLAAENGLFASRETPAKPVIMAGQDANTRHAAAGSRLPILAASVIVDEVVAEAERQASATAAPGTSAERAPLTAVTAAATGTAPASEAPESVATSRQVSAGAQFASVSVAPKAPAEPENPTAPDDPTRGTTPDDHGLPGTAPDRPMSDPMSRSETGDLPAPPVQLAEASTPRASVDLRKRRPTATPERVRQSRAYAYRCTFTCVAEGADTVKYPVDRVIRDVSEDNAGLVALDVLAMDNGVCLASGGQVYDTPRLPPVCERVD
jgi:hypothetical protein